MKLPPYTYTEAKLACDQHQHLIGKAYDSTGNRIDSVIVVPFEPSDRSRFFMLYLMLEDARQALTLDYSGTRYSVAVVSGSVHTYGMQHCDLHDWLSSEGNTSQMMHNAADTFGSATV
jgi:hypothetical protein